MLLVVAGLWGCANHRPELFPIYNQTVEVGSPLEFDVRAADGDGDRLSFGIVGKPDRAVFMEVGDNTARFQWTPNAADVDPVTGRRDYPVTFQVTDGMDRDSETVIITVLQYQANQGSPIFITPSNHTLDLDRLEGIEFDIQVQDDNSERVLLWLESGIPGAQFWTTPGAKTATFEWIPTPQQISERLVWSIRVGAQDQENPPVFQNITILILGGQIACDGTPPKLEHQPLPDGRGSEDYLVSVSVSDRESPIQYVYLYWLVDRHDGGGGTFEVKFMDPVGDGVYQESIPNPGLAEGQTATVSYYLCAVDDDDPAGEACDLRECLPVDGRFEFTAYPAGSQSCENDIHESNDSLGQATPVEFDSGGECALGSLKVCPGDVDWFWIEVPPDHRAGALLGYIPEYGLLSMKLYAEDGVTLLAQGTELNGKLALNSPVMSATTPVLLEVAGAGVQVENRYDLYLEIDPACQHDSFEPNNQPDQAPELAAGDYPGLTCCTDPDWYRFAGMPGDRLEVSIDFVNADGDLDLWVFDRETVETAEVFSCENALGCSTTVNDGEQVVVQSLPSDDSYFIAVFPYQGAQNAYQMTIDAMP